MTLCQKALFPREKRVRRNLRKSLQAVHLEDGVKHETAPLLNLLKETLLSALKGWQVNDTEHLKLTVSQFLHRIWVSECQEHAPVVQAIRLKSGFYHCFR